MLYLLNLTVSGIKNLKKEVRLDFYKKTIDKSFDPERYRVKAIYGENGSGKSAIVTAVKILQDLMANNNYLGESNNQRLLNEIVNKETKLFKIECEYIVITDSVRVVYNYAIHLGEGTNGLFEIKYERMQIKSGMYPNAKYRTVFECEGGKIVNIEVGAEGKELINRETFNLLSEHSMIYLYVDKVLPSDTEDIIEEQFSLKLALFFAFLLTFRIYLDEGDKHELYFLKKGIKDAQLDKQGFDDYTIERLYDVAHFASVSERRVDKEDYKKYEEQILRLTQFLKIFKQELKSIDIEKREDGEQYVCDLILNYGTYRVNKEFESTGIKKLIRLFDCFLTTSRGGIAFIDEMDSNLNDVYLCKIVEYFMYYGKGQLCFTTHNLDPMTVLKENKNSIDFLSSDNTIVQWTSRGNSSPDSLYRNGMIEDSPFNIDATDFIGILGE